MLKNKDSNYNQKYFTVRISKLYKPQVDRLTSEHGGATKAIEYALDKLQMHNITLIDVDNLKKQVETLQEQVLNLTLELEKERRQNSITYTAPDPSNSVNLDMIIDEYVALRYPSSLNNP